MQAFQTRIGGGFLHRVANRLRIPTGRQSAAWRMRTVAKSGWRVLGGRMGKSTVLITGCRAPVALEWARQLAAAGWRVVGADSMPWPLAAWSGAMDAFCRVPPARGNASGFLAAVAEFCRKESVGLVVPVCEEIFTLSAGRAQLSVEARLWAADHATLLRLHNKWTFIEAMRAAGLPVPDTRLIQGREDVERLTGDWFLKPCYSRFASAGRRWRTGPGKRMESDAAWLARQEIGPERLWVAQEFLTGAGWCATALADRGRVLAQAIYPVEWTAGPGACVSFRAMRHGGVEDWVARCVAATGFTGQIAFDFVDVPGRGVLPLECNPRGTSGLHLIPVAGKLVTELQERGAENPGSEQAAETCYIDGGCPKHLSVPMLLYGLPEAVRKNSADEWLRAWRVGREVAWAPGDAGPAWLGNAWTLAWFAKEAWRLRLGLTAATTADLEWNGD